MATNWVNQNQVSTPYSALVKPGFPWTYNESLVTYNHPLYSYNAVGRATTWTSAAAAETAFTNQPQS